MYQRPDPTLGEMNLLGTGSEPRPRPGSPPSSPPTLVRRTLARGCRLPVQGSWYSSRVLCEANKVGGDRHFSSVGKAGSKGGARGRRVHSQPHKKPRFMERRQTMIERLFYKLIIDNVAELLPFVYTTTEYDELIEEFMAAVKKFYGEKVLIQNNLLFILECSTLNFGQFEDFTNHNDFDLLENIARAILFSMMIFRANISSLFVNLAFVTRARRLPLLPLCAGSYQQLVITIWAALQLSTTFTSRKGGPAPRCDHSAVVYADRYLLIFGGSSHSIFSLLSITVESGHHRMFWALQYSCTNIGNPIAPVINLVGSFNVEFWGMFASTQSFDDTINNPGPKTTFEVGMLAGDSWKKVF
ncbi:NADP-dependent malic enzyme, chloroplastic [Zea mays]|uniref:NADP-dependent malic enzyme, chloroplastic n=1 Tax=Zea mays TaxID=4577 RepID=A0A3L6F7G6_MAIZE|nr:NADP-dependent malic enzyme, chloroplastic [Zea mays]